MGLGLGRTTYYEIHPNTVISSKKFLRVMPRVSETLYLHVREVVAEVVKVFCGHLMFEQLVRVFCGIE